MLLECASWRRFRFCGLLAAAVGCLLAARAQVLGPVKGFKLADPHPPPHENQIKSLLEAATAFRLPDGQVALTNAILRTFRETGQADLIAKAAYCLCNPEAHSANSPGPLQADTADGKFSILGEGFLWQQTNATLVISNRVQTEVKPDLKIWSDQLFYWADLGVGIYHGHMRLQQGTNWTLTAETLTFKLPRTERQLQEVTADTNVVVESATIRATGDHASYSADTGLMRMTGRPRWRADQREGGGEELVIDRTNKIFQANGRAWLKLPAQGLGTSGFLFSSNAIPARAAGSSNQFIEVLCDSYEIQTNSGVFRGQVRLSQRVGSEVRGKMSCSLTRANFIGTNELQSLVAETNVVIEQEQTRFTGGKAVYVGTNGVLKITEKPTWQSGLRSGKGDVLWVNQAQNEMVVRGHASVRLPAAELGQSALPGPAGNIAPASTNAGPQFADIFCDRYTLRPTNSVFHGGVYVTHPQMNWSAETVTVLMPAPGTNIMIAEQSVVFDVLDTKGRKVHGEGDKAVYTNSLQTLYTNGVKTIITNDIVRLTGEPAELIQTTSKGRSMLFIYDRANDKLTTGPDYQFEGVAPGTQTNPFALPRVKFKK
jgi:lipopolysaccharide export system protein LptA